MSSRLVATRPFLGVLALASTLALTACSSDQAVQPGGSGTPAGDGAVSSAAAETAAEAAVPQATDGQGTPAPTGEPAEERTEEPADEPVRFPAAEDPAGPSAAGTPAEGPAADGAVPAPRGGTADRGSDGTAGSGGLSRWCTASQLEITAAPAGGAAGSVWVDLTATNTGGSPCTLAGYPGVSFVDASGAMIGVPAVRDTSTPGTGQVVAPGESVTAALRVGQAANHPACDARAAAGLRVYPPESTDSAVVAFPARACADTRVQQLEIQGFGA